MWLVRSTDIVHIVYDVFLRIVSVRNTVYARLSGVTVRAGLTDKWETRIIQNIYFIEPRTKNKTIIYLLYTLYVHTHTHMYVCVCVYVYVCQNTRIYVFINPKICLKFHKNYALVLQDTMELYTLFWNTANSVLGRALCIGVTYEIGNVRMT